MNYEDCLKVTINDSVADVLDRLSELSAEDRWSLLMEHLENVATEIDTTDVLIVPNFQEDKGRSKLLTTKVEKHGMKLYMPTTSKMQKNRRGTKPLHKNHCC